MSTSTPDDDKDAALPGARPEQLTASLAAQGITGVLIAWADNNGILRGRTVPLAALPSVAERGVGITPLFSVFNTYDVIDTDYRGQTVPHDLRAEVRLVPVLDRIRPLPGQPGLAFAPGRILTVDGEPWDYDPRATLERAVSQAAGAGYELRFGFELEFFLGRQPAPGADSPELNPLHHGPAYSVNAAIDSGDFLATFLAHAERGGLHLAQVHAEFGLSQLEASTTALDPVAAADEQLLLRITLHQAARAHGLRVSFSPIVDEQYIGNGGHLHTSIWRDGANLLAPPQPPLPLAAESTGIDPDRVFAGGVDGEGAGFLAGLLEHLPAVSAIAAPSIASYLRRRPGWFAGAYQAWGVENREASLRLLRGGALLGPGYANIELKTSDASGNPYLAAAAVIAAGLDGVHRRLPLPEPVQVEPGSLDAAERERLGLRLLPTSVEAGVAELRADEVVTAALGQHLVDAFSHVRGTDLAWAEGKTAEELIAAQLWKY